MYMSERIDPSKPLLPVVRFRRQGQELLVEIRAIQTVLFGEGPQLRVAVERAWRDVKVSGDDNAKSPALEREAFAHEVRVHGDFAVVARADDLAGERGAVGGVGAVDGVDVDHRDVGIGILLLLGLLTTVVVVVFVVHRGEGKRDSYDLDDLYPTLLVPVYIPNLNPLALGPTTGPVGAGQVLSKDRSNAVDPPLSTQTPRIIRVAGPIEMDVVPWSTIPTPFLVVTITTLTILILMMMMMIDGPPDPYHNPLVLTSDLDFLQKQEIRPPIPLQHSP